MRYNRHDIFNVNHCDMNQLRMKSQRCHVKCSILDWNYESYILQLMPFLLRPDYKLRKFWNTIQRKSSGRELYHKIFFQLQRGSSHDQLSPHQRSASPSNVSCFDNPICRTFGEVPSRRPTLWLPPHMDDKV